MARLFKIRTALAVATVALSCLPTFAIAQAPPTPVTPLAATAPGGSAPVPPNEALSTANCPPGNTPQKGTGEPGSTTGQAGQPLGDQLAKSDGVLCPPGNVDPEIRAPTPGGGNTPVIPPPGSPGGDPTLRPK